MDIPTIQPPRIKAGDTIAVIAPAGTIEKRDAFERGISALERLGFRVRFDERIFQTSRYLAGDDNARAEELMSAFEDPAVQAVIGLRGGYGCARLIPLLREERLRHNPKIFMGFSDLTTLHLYFRNRLGWITFHGPMAASATFDGFPADQAEHLLSLWTDPFYRPVLSFPQMETWHPGIAEGELTGGCLSIVTASLGTPFEIRTEGRILFLEDQGEPPYRLDRMLTHLHLAGKFQSVKGVLLGEFLDCEPERGEYTAADTIRERLSSLQVPVIANLPAGHGRNNWTIPFGARVKMDATECRVEFPESAVI